MTRGPGELDAPPRERALEGFAQLLTQAPWTVGRADLDRLRAVGLSDEEVVQAVTIAAFFNHVTRVADATGIELDYESGLPRMAVDRAQQPLPRPPREAWPRRGGAGNLSLALRPATAAALDAWKAYALERDAPLTRRERRLVARTAAWHCCDELGVLEHEVAPSASEREHRLVAFAAALTLAPWATEREDLDRLREVGLDDAALLDTIALVGLANVLARVRLALS